VTWLWKIFIQRCKKIVMRDEAAIGILLAAVLLVLLVLLDVFVSAPDWAGIRTEIHGVFLEVFLIAVVAAIWLDHRERKQWELAEPIASARILEVYNTVAEAVTFHSTHVWVYRFHGLDVPCSFDFEPLSNAYRYISTHDVVAKEDKDLDNDTVRFRVLACALRANTLMCKNTDHPDHQDMLQRLNSQISSALVKADSILDHAIILMNHGPAPIVVTELMKMQQNLSTLCRVIGETQERLQSDNKLQQTTALQRLGHVAEETLEMCLLNGGSLATKAEKLPFFVLRENRIKIGKSVDMHALSDYEQRIGRNFDTPMDAIIAMEKELPNPYNNLKPDAKK